MAEVQPFFPGKSEELADLIERTQALEADIRAAFAKHGFPMLNSEGYGTQGLVKEFINAHGKGEGFSNTRYSMANTYGLSPQALDQLFRGKRNAGPQLAVTIEKAIGLSAFVMVVMGAAERLDGELQALAKKKHVAVKIDWNDRAESYQWTCDEIGMSGFFDPKTELVNVKAQVSRAVARGRAQKSTQIVVDFEWTEAAIKR